MIRVVEGPQGRVTGGGSVVPEHRPFPIRGREHEEGKALRWEVVLFPIGPQELDARLEDREAVRLLDSPRVRRLVFQAVPGVGQGEVRVYALGRIDGWRVEVPHRGPSGSKKTIRETGRHFFSADSAWVGLSCPFCGCTAGFGGGVRRGKRARWANRGGVQRG